MWYTWASHRLILRYHRSCSVWILTLDHWWDIFPVHRNQWLENIEQKLLLKKQFTVINPMSCHVRSRFASLQNWNSDLLLPACRSSLTKLKESLHWPSSTSENTAIELCDPLLDISEHFTFSGDFDGDAACRGPQVEFAVACTQCQTGASGVPLKAPHSRALLKHCLQAHILHVPHPHNTGHVVYTQRNTDTQSKPLSAWRAIKQ